MTNIKIIIIVLIYLLAPGFIEFGWGKEITFHVPDEVGQAMEKVKKNAKQKWQKIHDDVDVRIVFYNPNESCFMIISWKEDSYFYDNYELFHRRDIIIMPGMSNNPREVRSSCGEKLILVRVFQGNREVKSFPVKFLLLADGKKIKELPLVEGCYRQPQTPFWWRRRSP